MAKKSFSTAGMDILNLRPKETGDQESTPIPEAATPELEYEQPPEKGMELPVMTKTSSPMKVREKPIESKPQPQKLVRKSYYVTPAQHKALKIRAANGETTTEKDISTIIRTAIDMYLTQK